MNIVNPYNELEHVVYKRTFLRKVQVVLDFNSCDDILLNDRQFKDFVAKYFETKVPSEGPSRLSSVEICDDNAQVRFVLSEKSAKVDVGHKFYNSFAQTMYPLVTKLCAYIEQICKTSHIANLTIRKSNLWHLRTEEDIKNVYSSALRYTFREQHVEDMASMIFPNQMPFKVSKEGRLRFSGGGMTTLISAEVKNAHEAYFTLDFNASTQDINVDDAFDALGKLNEIVYCAFHDIVSKNVLELMKNNGTGR